MKKAIWFRSDLRTLDNEALYLATQSEVAPEAIFLVCEDTWQSHHWSPIKQDFLWRTLEVLNEKLAALGIKLHIKNIGKFSKAGGALREFCKTHNINKLYFNAEYALDEKNRDRAVTAVLENDGVEVSKHHGNLLIKPGRVKTQQGEYYKKFTPFNKRWRAILAQETDVTPLKPNPFPNINSEPLPNVSLKAQDSSDYPAGEEAALSKLGQFVGHSVEVYQAGRDRPDQNHTSELSAYLAIGAISPVTAARALQQFSPEFPYGLPEGPDTWLTELAWREFYQHLMDFEPRLSKGESFQRETDSIQWSDDEKGFIAWCEGKTGYPIVDAGMRQLNETGWMHNRLRMITANFLVKDLLIDWRKGEAYFMQNLIDGSFPSNNGGWQWSASVGTDAVPYFRVFNPVRQSEKFDPQGAYIRKWVKELDSVPDKHIHWPHEWLKNKSNNEYYPPIVEHKAARERFLTTFKQVKHG